MKNPLTTRIKMKTEPLIQPTEKELLRAILQEIKLLREETYSSNKPTMSTSEACQYLGVTDARVLTTFYNMGLLPSRYGGQKSGFKYSKKEVHALQTKLLIGEVVMPKR